MKIVFVRHGEPDYSIDSLTPKGFIEAKLLGQYLSKIKNCDYYTSPLGRAKDTCYETTRLVGCEAEVLPWAREFHAQVDDAATGKKRIPWNLMPKDWTNRPLLFDKDKWVEDGLMATGDVAENYEEIKKGIDALLARYGYKREGNLYRCEEGSDKTIVIFCHLAMQMVAMGYLLGLAPAVMWHSFFVAPSGFSTLVTEEREAGYAAFRCREVGSTVHLALGNEPPSPSGSFWERACDAPDFVKANPNPEKARADKE